MDGVPPPLRGPDTPYPHAAYDGSCALTYARFARTLAIMNLILNTTLRYRVLPALLCAALAAGCEKHEAASGALNGQAADAVKQAAQQAQQKLDQAASFVNQQLNAARAGVAGQSNQAASQPAASGPAASAADLASAAKDQWHNAASAAHAMLGQAAATTGTGLQAAGRALQQWASGAAAASGPAAQAQPGSDSQ